MKQLVAQSGTVHAIGYSTVIDQIDQDLPGAGCESKSSVHASIALFLKMQVRGDAHQHNDFH